MLNEEFSSKVRSWILLAVLLVVCIVLLTPMTLVDNIIPLLNQLGSSTFIAQTLQAIIPPLLILAFNSGILPLFIDLIAYLEGHKSKSSRQIGIMKKNYFF
jgi:hypothetical protein